MSIPVSCQLGLSYAGPDPLPSIASFRPGTVFMVRFAASRRLENRPIPHHPPRAEKNVRIECESFFTQVDNTPREIKCQPSPTLEGTEMGRFVERFVEVFLSVWKN
jgi:hypothetical protein